MNIRFVIFLLTIFMVFVPCYGMQVANNAIASDNITQIQNKNIEVKQKKSKINRKVWGILLFILGIGLVIANTVFVINSISTLNIILASSGLGITIFGDKIIRKYEPPTKEEDKINHLKNLGGLLTFFGCFGLFYGLIFLLLAAFNVSALSFAIITSSISLITLLVGRVLHKVGKEREKQ
jgi:amino acid transporter